jgi:hypothetical protein
MLSLENSVPGARGSAELSSISDEEESLLIARRWTRERRIDDCIWNLKLLGKQSGRRGYVSDKGAILKGRNFGTPTFLFLKSCISFLLVACMLLYQLTVVLGLLPCTMCLVVSQALLYSHQVHCFHPALIVFEIVVKASISTVSTKKNMRFERKRSNPHLEVIYSLLFDW